MYVVLVNENFHQLKNFIFILDIKMNVFSFPKSNFLMKKGVYDLYLSIFLHLKEHIQVLIIECEIICICNIDCFIFNSGNDKVEYQNTISEVIYYELFFYSFNECQLTYAKYFKYMNARRFLRKRNTLMHVTTPYIYFLVLSNNWVYKIQYIVTTTILRVD